MTSQHATEDDVRGMAWWNNLTEIERAVWMTKAGNTGRAVDAWRAFQQCDAAPELYRALELALNELTGENRFRAIKALNRAGGNFE